MKQCMTCYAFQTKYENMILIINHEICVGYWVEYIMIGDLIVRDCTF